MEIVNSINCKGIGELTKYDTIIRIAAYRNLFPTKVYLHSGTKVGAKNLLGKLGKRKYLGIEELPIELQDLHLSASEIEDILCIFKDDLKN